MTMHISPYTEYLVSTRGKASEIINGTHLHCFIMPNTVDVSRLNTYEIYTKDPQTGEGGYDIHFVQSTDNLIKDYPLFDCIITKNDGEATNQFIDYWNREEVTLL